MDGFGSKKGSAFNRAVGFKTIQPDNQENSDIKAYDNNQNNQYQSNKPTSPVNNGHEMSQQENASVNSQSENKGL